MKNLIEDKKATRIYYLDWQRTSVCWGVVLVHVIEGLRSHFKNFGEGEMASSIALELKLQQIGMPLLYISAGKTFAATRSSGSIEDFLLKKSRRLLVPCVVGYFLFVLPAALITPRLSNCFVQPEWSLFAVFKSLSCVGLWWLWFLPILVALLLMNFYLLKYIRTLEDESKHYVFAILSLILPLALGVAEYLVLGVSLLTVFFFLAPYFFVVFGSRYLIARWRKFGLVSLRAVFPLFACLMGAVQGHTYDLVEGYSMVAAGVMLSPLYYSTFIAQGFVESWVKDKLADDPNDDAGSTAASSEVDEGGGGGSKWWMAFVACFVPVFSLMALSQDPDDIVYYFAYPPYNAGFTCGFYILGTWCYWSFWELAFAERLNYKFGNSFWRHCTDSAFVIYLCHGLWVSIANRIIVDPLAESHILVALFSSLIFSYLMSAFCYVAVLKMAFLRRLFAIPNPPPKGGEEETQKLAADPV